MNMKLQKSSKVIERHRQHGDIAETARRANVAYQTAYQYINGNRKRGKGAKKYLEILAQVIAERQKMDRNEDAETAKELKQILCM